MNVSMLCNNTFNNLSFVVFEATYWNCQGKFFCYLVLWFSHPIYMVKKTKRFPVAFYPILEQTLNDFLRVYFTEYSPPPPPKCMNSSSKDMHFALKVLRNINLRCIY